MASDELNELIGKLLARLDSIENRLSKLEKDKPTVDNSPNLIDAISQNIQAGLRERSIEMAQSGVPEMQPPPEVPSIPETASASEIISEPQASLLSEPEITSEPQAPPLSEQEITSEPQASPLPEQETSFTPATPPVPEIPPVVPSDGQSINKTAASSLLSFAMNEKFEEATEVTAPVSSASQPKLTSPFLTEPVRQNSALETKIGSYWLNRIGLVALLIGVVSLLLYSFQFFGPIPKLGLGFLIGACLVYLSRKPALTTRPWFSGGLNALGWSITFFTAFAMHFVPGLHVIDSAIVEFFILAAISAWIMIDAVRANSEFTASLSTTFAALSIGIAAYYSHNPIVALLVLLAASTYISIRQGWFTLLLYSTAAYYATYFYLWYAVQQSSNWYWLATLGVGWLLIHVGVFFAQSRPDPQRQLLVWISVVNALLGSYFASWTLEVLFPTQGYMIAAAVLGAAYLSTSKAFDRKGDESLSVLHQLIGLSFLNMAKWDRFTGETAAVTNVIQVGLLASIGVRFKLKAFTWFATLLAIVTTQQASVHGWWVGALAFSVYGCVAYQYRYFSKMPDEANKDEYVWLSNYYWTLANAIGIYVIAILKDVADGWKALLLMAQGIINSTVLVRTRDEFVLWVTSFVLLLGACTWVAAFMMWHSTQLPFWLGLAVSSGCAWYFRKLHGANQGKFEQLVSNYYWTLSNGIAIHLIVRLNDIADAWKALLLLAQGMLNSTIIIRIRDQYLMWLTGFVLVIASGAYLFAFAARGQILPLMLGVVASTGYAWYCRELHEKKQSRLEMLLSNYFWTLANSITTFVIFDLKVITAGWKALLLLGQGLINSTLVIRTRDQYLIAVAAMVGMVCAQQWLIVFIGGEVSLQFVIAALVTGVYTWYCRKLHTDNHEAIERAFKCIYGCLSAAYLTAYIWRAVPTQWISTAVSVEGMVLIMLWFYFIEEWAWPFGVALFVLVVSRVFMFELAAYQTLVVLAGSFGFYLYCRHRNIKEPQQLTDSIKTLYCVFSPSLLTVYLLKNVASSYLSIVTGVEAMVLVVLGFVLREKLLRVAGLVVFAIVIGRLLFVDFASAPTVSRIFSFIVSGLMLVGCSYAYGWFSKWLIDNEAEKKALLESIPSEPAE